MSASTTSVQRRVAVIGGGAAGLVAARVLQRDVPNVQVTVLEKEESTGGVWRYKNTAGGKKESHHPMYRGLRTNLPKEIMGFREYPFAADNGEKNSYLTHGKVLEYLRSYARHFSLEPLIQFGAAVEQLTVLPGTKSAFQPESSGSNSKEDVWPKIRLDWITTSARASVDENMTTTHSQIFDAVCVCNGHYSLPVTPHIPGLVEYFKGRTLHSIVYDDPTDFADQTVLCIGGRASGSDVARELSTLGGARHVYLSDSSCTTASTQGKVTWVPKTMAVLPDGSVQFATTTNQASSTTTATDVDCIIFCTGYDYNFPFINDQSYCPLQASQRRVQPLYEHFWHAYYPNLAFVGLLHSVVPFPCFELQMEAFANQLQQHWTGGASLPDRLAAARRDAVSGGLNTGRVPDDTHYLGSAQWDYCRLMAKYADRLDDGMEQYLATNKVWVCRFGGLWFVARQFIGPNATSCAYYLLVLRLHMGAEAKVGWFGLTRRSMYFAT